MTLDFLHPAILGLGAAAVAVPIVIHLLLRQKPRAVLFPALLLVKKKQKQTIRRLRIRHWLLLALRCLLLLLLGLALARPTLRSNVLSIDQEAPIGAVIVFDDSPSMEMVERGQSRLDRAKELAIDAIGRMPAGSRIAVMTASNPVPSPSVDVANAVSRIRAVERQLVGHSMDAAMLAAVRQAGDFAEDRREIYVFSDQAESAWDFSDSQSLRERREELDPPASLFVIDVHADKLENISLAEPKLSSQFLTPNAELDIEVNVRNRGPAVDNVVRLSLDGKPRAEQPVRLPENQAVTLHFPIAGLGEGFHQGRIELAVNDAMPFDDKRFFTVDVQSAPRVLLVREDPSESMYWSKALAPDDDVAQMRARYAIEEITPARLDQAALDNFQVVALLNVASLSEVAWRRLSDFVQQGGGLFVALGPRVNAENYNSAAARQILPAPLGEIASKQDTVLVAETFLHPLLKPFAALGGTDFGDWGVFSYWKVQPTDGASVVVLPYANGDAGLLERNFGAGRRGRVLMLTTAAHYQQEGQPWSELPLGWSYLVLADQITRYLSGSAERDLNVLTGTSIELPRRSSDPFTVYAVQTPGTDTAIERISVDARSPVVPIPSAVMAGNYRVEASQSEQTYSAGFSVNIPEQESALGPIPNEQVLAYLGDDWTAIARSPTELEHVEGKARVGRELFAWIMLLFVAVVCAEGVLANRFYRTTTPSIS